jgi:lysophospholipid acyltransferase (LPLAT)-like uncharacterized protein
VWLAKATGNPVLPFHCEASSHWTLRSWDRTQIPKPFATVALAVGQPLQIAGTDETTITAGIEQLQHRLHTLEARARGIIAG